jgi:putative molybdopterin biosynthesis protein
MSFKRNVYLNMKSLDEARRIMFDTFGSFDRLAGEALNAVDAVGRVLQLPVFAKLSSPSYHLAAMDGVAVKAAGTFGASEATPKELRVGEDVVYVNTGHVLPKGTDAVIMIEHVEVLDETTLRIEAPVYPWQHVRRVGEDIVATEMLFSRNHKITPYCVGALLAAGVFQVEVKKKPKTLLMPTGSELVDWTSVPAGGVGPGQVIESNSHVLAALVEACGGDVIRHGQVVDDTVQLKNALLQAAADDVDVIMLTGGSSAGSEDYARKIIQDAGRVLVHGVTMMPGKPLIIGDVQGKPVFGIPGYPVSAIMAFEQFVGPLLLQMAGRPGQEREKATVEPARKIASKLGVEEFVRVKLGKVDNRLVATPLPRGAGAITTLTEADGIIRVPASVEGINAFAPVTAELLRPLSALEKTIVAVGSHDNTLDVLADMLRARHPGLSLSSSHVGSMGGLMAVKKGACHLAGIHLLDVNDGSYNRSYIDRYLPGKRIRLVTLVQRDQGLIVAKGNPHQITGIEDLGRRNLQFINRQGGSGTRILLDYRLQELGISPETVAGYQDEEYTHMAVAVAVLSGAADTGLGICAAAQALGLDFVPVVTEQYDLLIPEAHFDTEPIQLLLQTISSDAFKGRVKELGGYSTEKTGNVVI